jgi:hypothetical protein
MSEPKEFDVFLCHNSKDKPEVREIAQQLQQKGIKPWLDEWELRPGLLWQPELERQIENIKAAAVFIGDSGLGPWQKTEINAFLRQFLERGCPVIPVLLMNAPKKPELPLFLEGHTWVNFRDSQSNLMEKLIWGITGIKPSPTPETASRKSLPPRQQNRVSYNYPQLLKKLNWGITGTKPSETSQTTNNNDNKNPIPTSKTESRMSQQLTNNYYRRFNPRTETFTYIGSDIVSDSGNDHIIDL